MNRRENYLRAVRFERPDYIPMTFAINDACWQNYNQEALFELMEAHPHLFPNFKRPQGKYTPVFSKVARADTPYKDDFSCIWKTTEDGIVGTVVAHPLESWDDFESFAAPDYNKCMGIGEINWEKEATRINEQRQKGELIFKGLRHGHTFLQLCDIRGYQNLMFDFADEDPNIFKLIELVENFNAGIIRKYLDIGVDVISYADDLGMQKGPMVSPEHFRKYIKPSYQRLMKQGKDKNAIIHMHSDGDLDTLLDDIIDCGVDIINLQDIVNDVDRIAKRLSGKTCVELDIDRQSLTVFSSPREIERLIAKEVKTLGSKEGGLMMIFGLYPGVPMENIKALMDAMEKYSFYY